MNDRVIQTTINGTTKEFAAVFREEFFKGLKKKKEAHAMKVEYNGFTGELRELKAADIYVFGGTEKIYRLSIFIEEKQATVTFDNVELKDVKFLGGAVSFA